MNSAQPQRTRQPAWKPADLAFLSVALLLHAALLLLPLERWQNSAPPVAPRLTINLRHLSEPPKSAAAVEPTELEAPQAPEPEREPRPEPAPDARRTARIELDELPVLTPSEPPEETTAPADPTPLTARQLQALLESLPLHEDTDDSKTDLGKFRPRKPPANWNRHAGAPYLAESSNQFDGMTAPAEVEIVDRWQAADGSHNVVVNYPNGETLCGRAEAYNPLQPLVEPVMMWRPCAGGGKRTFSMPDRYSKGQ